MSTNPDFESLHPRGEGQRFAEKPQAAPDPEVVLVEPEIDRPTQIAERIIAKLDLAGSTLDEALVSRWIDADAVESMLIDAARQAAGTEPDFEPLDYPDKYRDLWNENMPSVSGSMYFSIPGEQPIHLTDDQAERVLKMLSSEA